MKIDLHCHSTCSDGSQTPTQLVKEAKDLGIDMLALTDHDTTAGIKEAKLVASEVGIRLIHGVEISCQHILQGGYGKNKAQSKIIHVLGFNFTNVGKMDHALQKLQDSREKRGENIVKKLATILNMDDNTQKKFWQQVVAKADGNPKAVGRAHIAQVMCAHNMVRSVQQAFDKYLADNKPAYVALETLNMAQTIDLVHACGGKAVLAHPTRYQLSATRVRKLIEAFARFGGDGCELPAANEQVSSRHMIDRCIKNHCLLVSIGSDYHGSAMPWRKLGDTPKLNDEQVGIWQVFE